MLVQFWTDMILEFGRAASVSWLFAKRSEWTETRFAQLLTAYTTVTPAAPRANKY